MLLLVLSTTMACTFRAAGTGNNNNQPQTCDDGVLDGDEQCDGVALDGETCQTLGYDSGLLVCGADCRFETSGCEVPQGCGNGVLDPNEGCDGNNLGGNTCTSLGLGDGSLTCTAACQLDTTPCSDQPECGDGLVQMGEACDDGNTNACDGCSPSCQTEACGDGVVECLEICDDGNQVAGDGCSVDCRSDETCGNLILDAAAGEVCDDGNVSGGDGCSADCRSNETCPNGVVDAVNAEPCDDGNATDWDGCNTSCECVEFQVNTYTTDNQYTPQLARAADGSFVVVWCSEGQDGSSRGVFLRRFDAAGAMLGPEQQVNTHTTDSQAGPRIAMAPDGRFVIAWQSAGQDGSSEGIFAQRFDATGSPAGNELAVNTFTADTQNHASVAMDAAGNFVLSWSSYQGAATEYDIRGRRFSSSGVALSAEFPVNTYTPSHQTASNVAMRPTGEFVVVWHSNLQDGSGYGAYGQRYDSAGVPQGTEFPVSSTTADEQRRPAVAMADDGRFTVIWMNGVFVTDTWDVLGRRFDSSGNPVGANFQLNTFSTGYERYPFINMLSDGRAIASWMSVGTDGDGLGAYSRLYDANGLPVGPEFQLNTYVTADQTRPFGILNADGSVWTVWHSDDQDGDLQGVFARRFDTQGVALCHSP